MRIPVFRTRAVATQEAPGRSIQARMRGDLLAQAELQKASVGQEMVAQIGEYAKMRYKEAEELKLNEALLAAEDGIRTASRDLSRSSQLYNIFEGENLWDQQTSAIRDQALDALGGNRFTRQKFLERYGQMEVTSRFQLRGVVDRKIEAAKQAAITARNEQTVVDLSDPGLTDPAAMIEKYNATLAGLTVDQARSVKNGTANPTVVQAANLKLKKRIAENVANAYIGSDPILAATMLGALEIQDRIDLGENVPKDEMPALPGGSYALYTLQNLPRDEAINVLADALTNANKFAALEEKMRQRAEAAEKDVIQNAKNRYFYYQPDETYSIIDLNRFLPNAIGYLPKEAFADVENIKGTDMRTAIETYLDASNAITPDFREKINKLDEEENVSFLPYREKSDPKTYDELFAYKNKGDLRYIDVEDFKRQLSREDYVYFMNSLETEEEEAVSAAKRYAQATFQYDEQTALDPDMGRASKAAFYSVVAELERAVADRRLSAEGPMAPTEINQLTRNLITDQKDFFDQQLRQDYIGTIDRYNDLYGGTNINLSYENPLADLDTWYSGLADQKTQEANYARIKSTLKREYFDKGFKF
jgi:HEPN domain-containing protein